MHCHLSPQTGLTDECCKMLAAFVRLVNSIGLPRHLFLSTSISRGEISTVTQHNLNQPAQLQVSVWAPNWDFVNGNGLGTHLVKISHLVATEVKLIDMRRLPN